MAYYEMTENRIRYDVFPLVVCDGKETVIHIRPLGSKKEFEVGREYDMIITYMEGADPKDFPATGKYDYTKAVFTQDGFVIPYTFHGEGEHCIAFTEDKEGVKEKFVRKFINKFFVYCVSADLSERYPFIGDLHVHSNLSDGTEDPEVVCANYRRYGYDFMAITDHHRYYPSLQAMNFYKDVPTSLTIVPGEEVQLPPVYGKMNEVHIVNFGGEYSVNALVEYLAVNEKGKDLSVRAIRENDVPDVMTIEEYSEKMQALSDSTEVPETVDPLPAAVCSWIFDEIRKSGGLGIYAHPNWRKRLSYQIPEKFTDYIMKTKPFDAFEVLGGETYFEQNGFQTIRYYEEKAKGNRFPVVGSTDSHSSSPIFKKGHICSTIIFAKENERTSLIEAVKDFYSVAVDTISDEFRLIGENRFVRYGCFLLENFFPLHDELCFEEGRLMKQYAVGTQAEKEEALKVLSVIKGRTERQKKKYFDF